MSTPGYGINVAGPETVYGIEPLGSDAACVNNVATNFATAYSCCDATAGNITLP